MSGQREAAWVALLLEHDALTSDDARDFMALADSEQAELRARAEKAEAEATGLKAAYHADFAQWDNDNGALRAERDRLQDGIQALADEAGIRRFVPVADLRALLSPTPEHSLVELSEPLFTEHPDGTVTPSTEPYRWRCRCGLTASATSAEEIKRLAFAHISPTPEDKP